MTIDPKIPISKAFETPEVEGHMPRIGGTAPPTDQAEAEVEGHMPRLSKGRAETEQADKAEVVGHAPRGPVVTQPSEDERTGVDDLDPEVTGHAPRGPVMTPPTDDERTGADDLEPEAP